MCHLSNKYALTYCCIFYYVVLYEFSLRKTGRRICSTKTDRSLFMVNLFPMYVLVFMGLALVETGYKLFICNLLCRRYFRSWLKFWHELYLYIIWDIAAITLIGEMQNIVECIYDIFLLDKEICGLKVTHKGHTDANFNFYFHRYR